MEASSTGILKLIKKPSVQNNIWTILASGVESLTVMIMIFLAVRLVGLAEAGILSFAFAVSGLLRIIITLGVRVFQSTDVNQEHTLNTYIGLRFCSAFVAFIGIGVFLAISGFEMLKVFVILLVFFIFLVDGFADVFMGDLQQKGKMRIAGRMRVCAFLSCLVAFVIAMFITRSLFMPLFISVIILLLVYVVWIWCYRKHFIRVRVKINKAAIKTLVLSTLPLAVSGLCAMFLYNSPKYFLGFIESDESVAIFTMLVMPLAMLNLLLHSFFAGAEITKTAEVFAGGNPGELSKRVNKQILFSLAFVAVYSLITVTFGIPLLSWFYNTDLSAYKNAFIMITLSCSAYYATLPIGAVVTVMRRQKQYMYLLVSAAAVTFPFIWFFIYRYGITGAAFSFMLIYIPLIPACYILYRIVLKKLRTVEGGGLE